MSIPPPDLERFLKAQTNSYENALAEIKLGKKISHWMWYIFPQFKGLGHSETSKFYAIKDIQEAREYLNHPILGKRLREISNELLNLKVNDPKQIFGSPDFLKLQSSMTLFDILEQSEENVFQLVLEKFYKGQKDIKTLELLNN